MTTSKIQLTFKAHLHQTKNSDVKKKSCDKEGQRFENKVTEGSHTNL